jgi:hypothetical protein
MGNNESDKVIGFIIVESARAQALLSFLWIEKPIVDDEANSTGSIKAILLTRHTLG